MNYDKARRIPLVSEPFYDDVSFHKKLFVVFLVVMRFQILSAIKNGGGRVSVQSLLQCTLAATVVRLKYRLEHTKKDKDNRSKGI